MTFVISILETITLLNVVGFKTIWAKHVHNLLFGGIRDFSFKNNVKRDLRKVRLGLVRCHFILSHCIHDNEGSTVSCKGTTLTM